MTPIDQVRLVLASTSRYRGQLLARIAPQFEQVAPQVDESARAGETAAGLAARLARAKAAAVAALRPAAIVIGSDQAAELDGRILGKPGTAEAACDQLRAASGGSVTFHTAVCVIDTRKTQADVRSAVDTTTVRFRRLDDTEIPRYTAREQPFDCAGSFKAEGLGIALFERIDSSDPTALIGLPLLLLCRLLRETEISVI